jgi:hypothetical protein
MNIELLTAIAVWLEDGAPARFGIDHFNMEYPIITDPHGLRTRREDGAPACGTSCCIAGAAVQFDLEARNLQPERQDEEGYCLPMAERLLALTEDQAYALFYSYDLPAGGVLDQARYYSLNSIDPAWAARVIRKFIATGNIDWTGTH